MKKNTGSTTPLNGFLSADLPLRNDSLTDIPDLGQIFDTDADARSV